MSTDKAEGVSGSSDRSDRPSMQQEWHPDHNMPAPEHNGVQMASKDIPVVKIPNGTPGTWTDLSNNSGPGLDKNSPRASDAPTKRSGYPR